MDFGFSRFFEVFEERFGRTVTTTLLAFLGLAVFAWCLKGFTETAIYFYGLVKSAQLLTVLESESAASHLVIFGAQVALTALILWAIWRWFIRRKLRGYQNRLTKLRTDLASAQKTFDEMTAKQEAVMRMFELHKDAVEKVHTANVIIQTEIRKQLAENPQLLKPTAMVEKD
jgi:hypothetical protein